MEMRPKALIVEDDPVTRSLLKALIEEEGCIVDLASDGKQAIDLLDRTPDYSVILLDIVLPKVSGTAVMEHLEETNPLLLEKIIVVTGLDIREIRTLFPTVCHALAKPVMPSHLLRWVRLCVSPSPQAAAFRA